ncbi:MAG: Spy/CpxP family protein refolding chaperone [Pyrinomonadaceae bacterium]
MKEFVIKLRQAFYPFALITAFFVCASAQQENNKPAQEQQQQQQQQAEAKQAEQNQSDSSGENRHHQKRHSKSNQHFNLLEVLNLTPEQRVQVRAIRQEHEGSTRAAMKRRARAQRALEEAIYADPVDEAAIDARSRDLADAHAEMVRSRTQVELRIRRLLTTEQLSRFRAFRRQSRLTEGGRSDMTPPTGQPRGPERKRAASPQGFPLNPF